MIFFVLSGQNRIQPFDEFKQKEIFKIRSLKLSIFEIVSPSCHNYVDSELYEINYNATNV